MRTSITFGYGRNNVAVRPNRQVNVTNDHPDPGDAVGWTELASIATATYFAVNGEFKKAASAILPTIKSAYKSKNVIVSKTAHETFPQGGVFILNGVRTVVDELRVVFRAESEDDLTTSFGKVDQSAETPSTQVRDIGERKQTHLYVRRFAIPLMTIVPGDYIFNFGSGDDGWFYDVGVSSILTVSIARGGHDLAQEQSPAPADEAMKLSRHQNEPAMSRLRSGRGVAK